MTQPPYDPSTPQQPGGQPYPGAQQYPGAQAYPGAQPNPGGQPYPPAQQYPGAGYDAGYGTATAPAAPAPAKHGRGRAIAFGAGLGGVLLLGGAGFAVAAYLSGGGPQPESVLPQDTIGFVKLDLDPAAGQKAAVMSLMQKFPALEDVDEDIKGNLLDELLQQSGAELTYAEDVEPWLGDRMAVAAVPDPGSEMGIAPVFVAAITDEEAMTDTLDRVRDEMGQGFGFSVRDEFVLIAQSQELADDLAAAEGTLEDDGDYSGDRDALGGDQIAVAWADLSAFQALLAQTPGYAEAPESMNMLGMGGELGGRAIFGIHAEDDALEIEGLNFGVSDLGTAGQVDAPSELVRTLPEDTIAAFGLGGPGERAVQAWEQLAATGMLGTIQDEAGEVGISLPDDLRWLLGSDLAIAMLGDVENPAVGARVATDDPQRALGVIEDTLGPRAGLQTFSSPAEGGFVVATDQGTAAALGTDGTLGETESFQRAVADLDDPVAVAYVDVAAILDQVDEPAGEGFGPDDLEPLDAVGMSSQWTDEGGRFVLRITTR